MLTESTALPPPDIVSVPCLDTPAAARFMVCVLGGQGSPFNNMIPTTVIGTSVADTPAAKISKKTITIAVARFCIYLGWGRGDKNVINGALIT